MTEPRSRWRRPLSILGLLALAAVLGLVLWIWRAPLDFYEATTRRALTRAGLERHEELAAGRRLVFWQGGAGPDLVLLHGAGDQAGTWARVVGSLLPAYRVTAIDLPGHGDSEPTSGPLTMAEIVGGVSGFLDSGGAGERPILVGNSLGAWTSMHYAWSRPDRVARVVAVNGGPIRGDHTGYTLTPTTREEARRLMEGMRDPSSARTPANVLDHLVRRIPTGPLGRLMGDLGGLEGHLLDGRLGEIATPIDILWGEADRFMGSEYPGRMAAALPRVRRTSIPACGHVPQIECPRRFAERLLEVLALPPPPPREAAPAAPTAAGAATAGEEGAGDDRR